MSARDWHLNLAKRLGLTLTFEEFTEVWNSALDPHPLHPDELFARLSRSHKLGLLSNTDKIHVEHLEKSYTFFQHFPKEVRTYSCSVGASKPDPLIYRQALKACKIRAGQALYIDDVSAYVDAARALGMAGIQYRSPEQLHTDLVAHGVSVE